MSYKLVQFRRGTSAEWSELNPILAAGELGYERDVAVAAGPDDDTYSYSDAATGTGLIKIGDGVTRWTDLPYLLTSLRVSAVAGNTNQTIALSGDASGSGTTSITVTIASGAVTNGKLAMVNTGTLKGRASASAGSPEDLTPAQVKSILAIAPGDITGFDTQVRSNPLNLHSAATGSYSMGGFGLTNVVNPTNAQDVATKSYCDNISTAVPANYLGQTTITTLGTIATGVWHGTAIAVSYGGLGLTSAVTGLLKGNGTTYAAAVAGTDYLAPASDIDGGSF